MNTKKTITSLWLLGSMLVWQGCTSSPGAAAEAAPAAVEAVTHTVQIVQMKFEPAEIHVRPGDQIVFINLDMVTHDVTEETSRAWKSPPIPAGESWTLEEVRQSDQYFCSLHQVMKGRIVVEE